jgi:hypothetical protein
LVEKHLYAQYHEQSTYYCTYENFSPDGDKHYINKIISRYGKITFKNADSCSIIMKSKQVQDLLFRLEVIF